jgi:hypothetical protein
VARGWESKSVEAQQEDRERGSTKGPKLTEEQRAVETKRRTLSLAKARIQADLAVARNLTLRKNLQAALKDLDEQLSKL